MKFPKSCFDSIINRETNLDHWLALLMNFESQYDWWSSCEYSVMVKWQSYANFN